MKLRVLGVVAVMWCAVVGAACATDDTSESTQAATNPATLEVTPATSSLPVEATQRLMATGHYVDGSKKNLTAQVTWTSSDGAIATVSAAGVVTAVHAGTATITAVAAGGASASAAVAVTSATLVSLTMSPAAPTLVAGATRQLTAVGKFSDGTRHDLSPAVLAWTTNAPAVATVSAAGLVAAAGVGHATITATHAGGIACTSAVTVSAATLKSIAITPTAPTFPIGLDFTLAATGTYTDGTTADLSASVTWTSATPAIAVITSDSGIVQTLATGSTVITATLGAKQGNTTVHVSKATLTAITLASPSAMIPAGASQVLRAIGQYNDGTSYDVSLQANWTTADSSIAAVSNALDSYGTVFARAPGLVAISAADPTTGLVGSAPIQVNPATLARIGVVGSPVIDVGQVSAYRALAYYTDGTSADISQSVAWSTSDPSVGTVAMPPDGGDLTGEGLGTVTLTAFYAASNQSGAASVRVKAVEQTGLAVTPGALQIPLGYSEDLQAFATYDNNTGANVTSQIAWSTDNAAVATVDAAGVVHAVARGTAHVTATGTSPGFAQTVTVTIAPAVFAQPTTYAVDPGPSMIRAGDFDEDGILDLAEPDYQYGIHLLFGTGGGAYRDGGELLDGAADNIDFAIVDLDGDHHLDLVTSNYTRETIAILYGRGDGTFEPAVFIATGANSAGVNVADVDGDGVLDLVSFANPNDVLIAYGAGGRAYADPVDYPLDPVSPSDSPSEAAFADLDGDGRTDLVIADQASIRVLTHTGARTFAQASYAPEGSDPKFVAIGDLDGHGHLGAFVANNSDDTISTYTIAASGALTFVATVQVGDGPSDLALADFDGDGHLDFATANSGNFGGMTTGVSVALGRGDGTFGEPYLIGIGSETRGVVAVDLDGDGHPDLAACSALDDLVYVVPNRFATAH